MTRGGLPALAALEIADDPELWAGLGFDVKAGSLTAGGVTIALTGRAGDGAGPGIRSWSLRAAAPLPAALDGIPTYALGPHMPAAQAGSHPNGVSGVDHVVVTTPDIERTLTALRGAGMEVRRVRDAGTAERPLQQAFLWAGEVLVEVAGPPQPTGDEPARLWGLVLVAPDVDVLTEHWGAQLGTPRDAVQAGRRIASLTGDAGSSVRVAFMTPHQSAAEPVESAT